MTDAIEMEAKRIMFRKFQAQEMGDDIDIGKNMEQANENIANQMEEEEDDEDDNDSDSSSDNDEAGPALKKMTKAQEEAAIDEAAKMMIEMQKEENELVGDIGFGSD